MKILENEMKFNKVYRLRGKYYSTTHDLMWIVMANELFCLSPNQKTKLMIKIIFLYDSFIIFIFHGGIKVFSLFISSEIFLVTLKGKKKLDNWLLVFLKYFIFFMHSKITHLLLK